MTVSTGRRTRGRVSVSARCASRLARGHLWVFSSDVTSDLAAIAPGDVCTIVDPRGRGFGTATVNPHALIAARLLGADADPDDAFLRTRLRDAIAYRERVLDDVRFGRLVYGESDGLPGFVVDRYGDVAVVQTLTAGAARLEAAFCRLVVDVTGVDTVVLANDSPFRALEGLGAERRMAIGTLPGRVIARERDLELEVDVLGGQKTGYFYDQRDTRATLGAWIDGGRVLDLFCYTGAFALEAARHGASVVGRDRSPGALEIARRNADAGGVAAACRFEHAELLGAGAVPGEEASRFDVVVLDPPPLARNRRARASALRAMTRLCRDALVRVRPGGLLIACTCSHHLTRADLLSAVGAGGAKLGRELRLVAETRQAADHPVLPAMPETEYLFALFVEVR